MAAIEQVEVLPTAANPGGTPATTSKVTHPDLLAFRKPGEDPGFRPAIQLERGETILALLAFLDHAAQQVRHQLMAVADSQHGMAGVENRRIHRSAAVIVDAARAAGDDQAFAARPDLAAGVSLGRTSAYTPRSRTLRAIRWQYCPPASSTVICGTLI